MRNYAVQVGPETIDVGRPQAVHPFRSFSLPVVAALSRRRAAITRLEVRCLFRIFAYGFHGLSFALLVWEFVFWKSGGGCELRMGWVRPLFRHRKYRVPARHQLFENSLFSPIFYRWIAVGAPGDASARALAAD